MTLVSHIKDKLKSIASSFSFEYDPIFVQIKYKFEIVTYDNNVFYKVYPFLMQEDVDYVAPSKEDCIHKLMKDECIVIKNNDGCDIWIPKSNIKEIRLIEDKCEVL